MIVCPVCEHAQAQGAECEVCGKRLVRGAAAFPAVEPVAGLEPTRHAAVEADLDPLAELEPTRHRRGADAPPEPVPGVEPTAALPVDVEVPPVPELEPTASDLPGDAPTEVPAVVTCRYCRTPAPAGERLCGRCGMRLPTFAAPPGDTATAARRCGCGLLVTAAACPSCGARA